jgi:hypothetical protein
MTKMQKKQKQEQQSMMQAAIETMLYAVETGRDYIDVFAAKSLCNVNYSNCHTAMKAVVARVNSIGNKKAKYNPYLLAVQIYAA